MKKIFVAVQVDYTGKESFPGETYNDGKQALYAFVDSYEPGTDIVRRLGIIGGLRSATLCETRKQADDLVTKWISSYKERGIYAF